MAALAVTGAKRPPEAPPSAPQAAGVGGGVGAVGLLTTFLEEAASRPTVWGVCDCLLQPADWVRLRTGRDPAARWRGAYHDQAQAQAILDAFGGLDGLMDEALAPIGWVRRTDPATAAAGDVGALEVMTRAGRQLVGAVRTERFWAVRVPTGLGMLGGVAAAVWTPPLGADHG